jgi:hypothetical protein
MDENFYPIEKYFDRIFETNIMLVKPELIF